VYYELILPRFDLNEPCEAGPFDVHVVNDSSFIVVDESSCQVARPVEVHKRQRPRRIRIYKTNKQSYPAGPGEVNKGGRSGESGVSRFYSKAGDFGLIGYRCGLPVERRVERAPIALMANKPRTISLNGTRLRRCDIAKCRVCSQYTDFSPSFIDGA
jgi:hypothetical protein